MKGSLNKFVSWMKRSNASKTKEETVDGDCLCSLSNE
jgi:hypothetical protein